jgi:hypothetical protein
MSNFLIKLKMYGKENEEEYKSTNLFGNENEKKNESKENESFIDSIKKDEQKIQNENNETEKKQEFKPPK